MEINKEYLEKFPDLQALKEFLLNNYKDKNLVIIISCSKSKNNSKLPAKELYDKSILFNKSYNLARELVKEENIRILSAKHGILKPNEVILPYDKSIDDLSKKELENWQIKVESSLSDQFNHDESVYLFMTGKKYFDYTRTNGNKIQFFPKGMGIGQRLQYLTAIRSN